jgi:hypothetical protein
MEWFDVKLTFLSRGHSGHCFEVPLRKAIPRNPDDGDRDDEACEPSRRFLHDLKRVSLMKIESCIGIPGSDDWEN